MKTHSTARKRLSMEALERRMMLAGNVSARISNGSLVIRGDDSENIVGITAGPNAGEVVVAGFDAVGNGGLRRATRINGVANDQVTLDGFTRGIVINLLGGADAVLLTDINVPGSVTINAGKGHDHVGVGDVDSPLIPPELQNLVGPVDINGNLVITTAQGNDLVGLTTVDVGGRITISTLLGDDDVLLDDVQASRVTVDASVGSDFVEILNSDLNGLVVYLGPNGDRLTMGDTNVDNKTVVYGGASRDTFEDLGGNTFDSIKRYSIERRL